MKDRSFDEVGNIDPPEDFEYKDVFRRGRPHHEKFDDFYKRHPFMSISKRAKIFSPFDALKGFNEAAAEKEVLYQPKIMLDEEVQNGISRQLDTLHRLTVNSRMARNSLVVVRVPYFVPCSDKNNEAYGYRGQYQTIEGVCRNVDSAVSRTITVDDTVIAFDDILSIEY